MEYVIPVKNWYDAKAISRSNLSVFKYVYNKLDDEHKKKLKDSCFSKFCEIVDIKLSGKLMHSLLLRRKASQRSNIEAIGEELWFGFGDKRLCFSLLDFTLITGLNPGNEEDFKDEIPIENRLLKEYFDDAESVAPNKLKEAFEEKAKTEEDRYKLGLVYIYEGMLRAKEPNTSIEVINLAIVDNLDLFYKYPWGKKCYDFTIRGFQRNNISKKQYSLWGFPIALQVWAFECIPDIAEFFGASKSKGKIPRMCSWKSVLTPSHEDVENVLKNSEVCSLEATPEEIEEHYMKTFFEEFSHGSSESTREARVSPQRNDSCRASVGRIGEDDIHRPSSPAPPNIASSRIQPTQSYVLKQILDAIGALDKKVDALDRKVDALDKKVDALSNNGEDGVSKMDDIVEPTPTEDENGGVPKTNHIVELTPTEDGNCGNPKTNHIMETNSVEDGDVDASTKETTACEGGNDDFHMTYHTLETTPDEDGDVDTSTKDYIPGSKIEVHEKENCKDDDAVEVSDDDAQSSNENDAGLLGRGHRKRKPAPVKCTPFTDPSKRKKLTNATQFDAYRVVDSSKKDDLDRWLEKAVDGEELNMAVCNVSRKFFDELLSEEWLMSDHIDIALYHIRERAAQYPQLFDQNSCVLDSRFFGLMETAGKIICSLPRTNKADKLHSLANFFTNNQDVSCVRQLVRYVDGESPELGKAWKDCRFLYIPLCVKSHWIALRVDIQERKIEVYNSLGRVINRQMISVIESVLPKLICARLDNTYGLQSLSSKSIACPQQLNGYDCGMFTVKYIEFLLAGKDVSLIRPDYMREWRKKLAADIFSQSFDL